MDDVPHLELRQYLLHPGRRDDLVALFDREFVESQEAAGMYVLGQFRDLDRSDHFVWLRGFPDLPGRRRGLEAFYGGPVWRAHRDAANATMIDSDDVLLLRPIAPGRGLSREPDGGAGGLTITVHHDVDRDTALAWPGEPLALYETDPSPNEFPALPVREGERVVVRIGRDGVVPPGATQVLRLEPTPRSRLR
jgi:hypothetical protein